MEPTSPVATASAGVRVHSMMDGLRWRVTASILGPIAWLSFTLLYVGFWDPGFTLFQSVIVILVSILVLVGVMATLWTSWGMRRAEWRSW